MEIRKVAKTSVNLITDHASVLAFPNEKSIGESSPTIVLGTEAKGSFAVKSPGEYETGEVWILSMNMDPNEEQSKIYVMNANGIRVTVIDSDVPQLTKKQIDKIGLVDILIINKTANLKDLVFNVEEIEPQVFIPTNFTDEEFASIVKELGANNVSEEKRYKSKIDDFNSEDYQLSVIKLLN